MTTTILQPKQRTGRPRKHPPSDERAAVLDFTPTVGAMCQRMTDPGDVREIMCVGPRGDGKTIGVLAGILAHAAKHDSLGFPMSGMNYVTGRVERMGVKWLGVTTTFTSHRDKTWPSLCKPFWKGCWQKQGDGHEWHAYVNGNLMVTLHLLGIEDLTAVDRVRTECHGVWFEEPAPTAMDGDAAGMREDAWGTAMSSQRLETHARVAVMTLNYPDADHWSWQRFLPSEVEMPEVPSEPEVRAAYYQRYASQMAGHHPRDPSRAWFRIPPGERADKTQRAELERAFRDRPDLLRRLVRGLPGSITLGPHVADGFSYDLHVAPERVYPVEGEPLGLGIDFGLTPTCIIGQPVQGQRRIYASLTLERGGIMQLIENEILPWLSTYAPWCLHRRNMLYGCYDRSGETAEQSDIERDPVSILEAKLPGLWFPGPVNWDARKHVLLSAMHHTSKPGKVSLQCDPVGAKGLIQALGGRWYYATDRLGQVRRDLPKKPNHPWEDYGDALIYWLWSLTSEQQPAGPITVETQFSLDRGLVGRAF